MRLFGCFGSSVICAYAFFVLFNSVDLFLVLVVCYILFWLCVLIVVGWVVCGFGWLRWLVVVACGYSCGFDLGVCLI